jgi:hypothetical protein
MFTFFFVFLALMIVGDSDNDNEDEVFDDVHMAATRAVQVFLFTKWLASVHFVRRLDDHDHDDDVAGMDFVAECCVGPRSKQGLVLFQFDLAVRWLPHARKNLPLW